jgi:NAD(P)H-hydrate epimerase
VLLVTAAEMRELDRHVIDQIGVPGVVLMDTAGRGVAELIASLVDLSRASVVIYAGTGNNGGDGFVVARLVANHGATAHVILCGPAAKVTGDAHTHLYACKRSGVEILDGSSVEALDEAAARTAGAAVVVDALFGTGLERPIAGHYARAVEHVNAHRGIKIAVDIPSGLSADTGAPLGPCVKADHTVTFGFCKRGLAGAPGFVYAGALHIVDIGIPERLAHERGITAHLLDDDVLAPLAPRDPLAHKGTHGHVLVLAGSLGKTGAALLCGGAALRAGAGLTTLVAPEDTRSAIDGRVPELMTAWYVQGARAGAEICALLDGKRALAAGPGLSPDAGTRASLGEVVKAALARSTSIVLDADALNHVAAEPSLLDGDAARELVLTPHPGEAGRLAGRSTAEVQADRIGTAGWLARRFRAVVALKGARTVIAAPDGRVAICPTGNAGMGTGGTGDVLTGIVGALLAHGLPAFEAACAAVYLHGAAGDRVAAEHGQTGLLASDLIDAIPRTLADRLA